MTVAHRQTKPVSIKQWVALLLLLGLFLFGAVPGYLQGQWPWQSSPPVATLKQQGNLQNRGVELPGWTVVETIPEFPVGGHQWIAKQIQAQDNQLLPPQVQPWVLLRAQLDSGDMPQVDWTDLQGQFRWSEDDVRRISWTQEGPGGSSGPSQVEARFVRGWQTGGAYGVLQWYAWPGGGSPEPGDWFWRDRAAQWQGKRVPWVAAAILIPLPSGADLDAVQPLAETLGRQLQQAIEAAIAPQ